MSPGFFCLVLWRSAFQAPRAHRVYPGTAYPVIVAALRSAFQAHNACTNCALRVGGGACPMA